MSAGQQRRIMIGRALVGSSSAAADATQMLLLDEPSNALDLAAQADLRNLLRKLAQQGTGILLITHHIADILPEIDRILLMREWPHRRRRPQGRPPHRRHPQRPLQDQGQHDRKRRLLPRLVTAVHFDWSVASSPILLSPLKRDRCRCCCLSCCHPRRGSGLH